MRLQAGAVAMRSILHAAIGVMRSSAAWNPDRRSSLPLSTWEYSATSVQPWLATKARTLACCGLQAEAAVSLLCGRDR